MRALRPLLVPAAYALAPSVRRAARLNAARIFGPPLAAGAPRPAQRPHRFGPRVLTSFYDFSLAVAGAAPSGRDRLLARVRTLEGTQTYLRARAARRGVVLVTGHIGSFEVGLAALTKVERSISVVFKRDASAVFEAQRADLRRVLGVHEVAIDEGLAAWGSLRATLERDGAVVMQGDRAVPGQKHLTVPFLGGHLRVPTGPARLALLTGSPLVACVALPAPRLVSGPLAGLSASVASPRPQIDVRLSEPIDVRAVGVDNATRAVTRAIEQAVAQRPECWLVLEPAFVEDQAPGVTGRA